MSIGNYQFHVVVRRKGNRYASGTASELPLRNGWIDIDGGGFGFWYGSQARYRPCQKAFERAADLAEKLNKESSKQPEVD